MSFGKHFKDSDFTLYEKNGDIFSLQWKFDNFFRNNDMPALFGGGGKKHLNTNKGMSVPLGLALLDKQNSIESYQDIHNRKLENRGMDGGVLNENIYQKLLSLADSRNQKKSKRKTRRRRGGKKKRKTRKI